MYVTAASSLRPGDLEVGWADHANPPIIGTDLLLKPLLTEQEALFGNFRSFIVGEHYKFYSLS